MNLFLKKYFFVDRNFRHTLEDVEFIFEFEIFIHQPQSKTSLCSKVIPHDSVDAFRDFEFIFELYSRLLSTLEFLVYFKNILKGP